MIVQCSLDIGWGGGGGLGHLLLSWFSLLSDQISFSLEKDSDRKLRAIGFTLQRALVLLNKSDPTSVTSFVKDY